jgi:hypothetical protein
MKQYNPLRIKPNANTLCDFLQEQTLSQHAHQSLAYKAVYQLFETATSFYKTLDFFTNPSLSTFIDNKKYLTALQEHDLIALTSHYIMNLGGTGVRDIVANDPGIGEDDRKILMAAIQLFYASAEATATALGNPCWIE